MCVQSWNIYFIFFNFVCIRVFVCPGLSLFTQLLLCCSSFTRSQDLEYKTIYINIAHWHRGVFACAIWSKLTEGKSEYVLMQCISNSISDNLEDGCFLNYALSAKKKKRKIYKMINYLIFFHSTACFWSTVSTEMLTTHHLVSQFSQMIDTQLWYLSVISCYQSSQFIDFSELRPYVCVTGDCSY